MTGARRNSAFEKVHGIGVSWDYFLKNISSDFTSPFGKQGLKWSVENVKENACTVDGISLRLRSPSATTNHL